MKTDIWPDGVHPAADLFPMMTEEELVDLVADIAANGLLQPVYVMPDGALLDGRNRVAACAFLELSPIVETYDGDDPIGFVLSLNLKRRHLTTGQKAMLALEVERMLTPGQGARTDLHKMELVADRPQVRERDRKSRERAAKSVGTSGRAVARAKRIQQQAPDLAEKVAAGDLALDRADRIVRDREAAERRAVVAAAQREHMQRGTTVDVRQGDFREVLTDLRNIDAIITDPPYPREFLPLLDDLAKWADSMLSEDGVLVVLFGQTYLPEVYRRLDGGRPYRWTGCYLTPGAGYASMLRRVQSNWKPVLVYGGGERFSDMFRSEGSDVAAKSHHMWGQDYGAFHQIVERLTQPGQTIVDPFMGSGTTLLAAKALGRHAIGCDIDPTHVVTARERLGL